MMVSQYSLTENIDSHRTRYTFNLSFPVFIFSLHPKGSRKVMISKGY